MTEDLSETTANTLAAIGRRVREMRLARGMTLQTLADTARLSPSMLSLIERGRAPPSIGSLIMIASSLGTTISDLVVAESTPEERIIVREQNQPIVEVAQHVTRRVLRRDRARGISIAVNEYEPHTGSAETPIAHEGFEYGYILEGELTVDVDGVSYQLRAGDLISYRSRRPHRFWNNGKGKVRTLWFNLEGE